MTGFEDQNNCSIIITTGTEMSTGEYFHLSLYEMRITSQGNTVVLISGSRIYYNILLKAFPTFHFSPMWDDQFNRYDWGIYINGISDDDRGKVKKLLDLFARTVCIDTALEQAFALDYHMQSGGGEERLLVI